MYKYISHHTSHVNAFNATRFALKFSKVVTMNLK